MTLSWFVYILILIFKFLSGLINSVFLPLCFSVSSAHQIRMLIKTVLLQKMTNVWLRWVWRHLLRCPPEERQTYETSLKNNQSHRPTPTCNNINHFQVLSHILDLILVTSKCCVAGSPASMKHLLEHSYSLPHCCFIKRNGCDVLLILHLQISEVHHNVNSTLWKSKITSWKFLHLQTTLLKNVNNMD